MRAAIYARYSSELQSPTSIEDQIRKCQQAAEQMGWEVLTDYIRSDSELSGAALAPRVALLSLINDAKKLPRPKVILASAILQLFTSFRGGAGMTSRTKTIAGGQTMAVTS